DDLMRLFGGDRLKSMMERLKVPDDIPLENKIVSRSIESAQKKVEGRNFDIRRHVVQYDDVMNKHREIIYTRRQAILEKLAEIEKEEKGQKEESAFVRLRRTTADKKGQKGNKVAQPLHEDILQALKAEAKAMAEVHASGSDPEKWDTKEIHEIFAALHPQLAQIVTVEKLKEFADREKLHEAIEKLLLNFYDAKCKEFDAPVVSQAERVVTLRSIDTHWMDHIDEMSHLREQVAFSGYAQRDPLIEYKDQGFRRFQQLLAAIDSAIVRTLLQIDFTQFSPQAFLARAQAELESLQTNEDQIAAELTQTGVSGSARQQGQNSLVMQQPLVVKAAQAVQRNMSSQAPRNVEKVGRNDPCPCGSGKKYKKCHGH
ncbi:SEC-C domain-containing protein, partial [Patescibacteria group bacterium]|nr:SEC-C domain-containing protein [Patescibacteria group bacterium]